MQEKETANTNLSVLLNKHVVGQWQLCASSSKCLSGAAGSTGSSVFMRQSIEYTHTQNCLRAGREGKDKGKK